MLFAFNDLPHLHEGKCHAFRMFQLFWDVAVRPWLENDILFRLFGYKGLKLNIEKFSRNVINEIIDMAKAKKQQGDSNNNEARSKLTMVDLQEELPGQQLMQEVITLIVSGQDTSASANSAALFLLSMHQQTQQEVNI